MDDKQHDDQMVPENGENLQMRKTALQFLLQVKMRKKQLEYQQPGKRCELLIFKMDSRNPMVFCMNL